MKLVVATNNIKKAAELHALLSPLGVELLTLAQASVDIEIEETGDTFAQNALLKASHANVMTGLPAVADDSGLCVDALDGGPGVYSARYGGVGGDVDRSALLLKNMERHDDRACAFVCCMCLVLPYKPPVYFEGVCRGELLRAPRGSGGFGYDPIFWVPEFQCSMAELTPEIKNLGSHRGRAARKLAAYIADLM